MVCSPHSKKGEGPHGPSHEIKERKGHLAGPSQRKQKIN
jgi:hypothetical protein